MTIESCEVAWVFTGISPQPRQPVPATLRREWIVTRSVSPLAALAATRRERKAAWLWRVREEAAATAIEPGPGAGTEVVLRGFSVGLGATALSVETVEAAAAGVEERSSGLTRDTSCTG